MPIIKKIDFYLDWDEDQLYAYSLNRNGDRVNKHKASYYISGNQLRIRTSKSLYIDKGIDPLSIHVIKWSTKYDESRQPDLFCKYNLANRIISQEFSYPYARINKPKKEEEIKAEEKEKQKQNTIQNKKFLSDFYFEYFKICPFNIKNAVRVERGRYIQAIESISRYLYLNMTKHPDIFNDEYSKLLLKNQYYLDFLSDNYFNSLKDILNYRYKEYMDRREEKIKLYKK